MFEVLIQHGANVDVPNYVRRCAHELSRGNTNNTINQSFTKHHYIWHALVAGATILPRFLLIMVQTSMSQHTYVVITSRQYREKTNYSCLVQSKRTPLHAACLAKAPYNVIELLLTEGADLAVRDQVSQKSLFLCFDVPRALTFTM